MITEFFVGIFNTIGQWFVGLFGDADVPAWITGVSDAIGNLFSNASGLGAWVPFALIGGVGGTVLATWFVLWLVKLIRWGWGLTPFSGGS